MLVHFLYNIIFNMRNSYKKWWVNNTSSMNDSWLHLTPFKSWTLNIRLALLFSSFKCIFIIEGWFTYDFFLMCSLWNACKMQVQCVANLFNYFPYCYDKCTLNKTNVIWKIGYRKHRRLFTFNINTNSKL